MDEEDQNLNLGRRIETDQELKRVLTATFRGSTQQQASEAHLILNQSLQYPEFIPRLANLISTASIQDNDIKTAAANLLKIYSKQYAEKEEEDKSNFIETLYNLIMQDHHEIKIKHLLGVALEYQFYFDERALYKNIVKEKVLQIFRMETAITKFDSCIAIFAAYFNSITDLPEQMFDFFNEIIQPISANALQIYQLIAKLPPYEWASIEKQILAKLTLLFGFLQETIDKLTEEEEYYEEDLKMIKKSEFLIGLLENYLLLFHNNHSIISRIYPSINQLKQTITNIVKQLYSLTQCPQKMFQMIFLTVILESREVVNDPNVQNILINCLKILESHLMRQKYEQIFQKSKMQLVFALFMYSVANAQEYEYINEDPEQFAQLAEDYTEGIGETYRLKPVAASLLRIFSENNDEAPRSILDILMVIMSGSLNGEHLKQSEYIQSIKVQFSKFAFYHLRPQQKLETSLMILAGISCFIKKREDIRKIVYNFLLAQFQTLAKITSSIVILRIIRLISYYPTALYFMYIEAQMSRGKAFILEGVKSFEKILRANQQAGLFQLLSNIFVKLMAIVKIQDPVMELMVINLYNQMLKGNPELYCLCRAKIKESFFLNMNHNQHATFICFNLLYFLLRKEQDSSLRAQVEKEFFEIAAFLEAENGQLYSRYEQKLIENYQVILERSSDNRREVERFAEQSLRYLDRQERGGQIFQFYNVYLAKLVESTSKFDSYFRSFYEQVKRRFTLYINKRTPMDVVAYYCFLMSQIIANRCDISLNEDDLKQLLEIAEKSPEDGKQYPIFVFLTFLYTNPRPTVAFLKKYSIYEHFLNGVTKILYEASIVKKVFNLAYIMLLQVQDSPVYVKRILIQCIHNLKEINRNSQRRLDRMNNIQVRPRRYVQQNTQQHVQYNEEEIGDQKNDNQFVNPFVRFKHPFEMISQFDQFKAKFMLNEHLLNDLDPNTKADLRSIMETEMIDKAQLRIIRKIRR